MGVAKTPVRVKLITAIFTNQSKLFPTLEAELEKKYGEIDFKSPVFGFDYTDYYRDEMGPDLKKKFMSFENLIKGEELSTIKTFTNALEKKYSVKGKRTINIDPGYINNCQLVLASTKNYYHRIYLGKGIFAEVTLFFKEKTFQPLPWTYPDYKIGDSISIFNKIREIYRKQLAADGL
ncbi:MAG: DUF4416 family protein [Candidatus Ratteibacteria bacterium]|nr:DUF4416 family protein [Candidatus Ratteibacteria bacterium]